MCAHVSVCTHVGESTCPCVSTSALQGHVAQLQAGWRSKAEATWVPICARQRARVGAQPDTQMVRTKKAGRPTHSEPKVSLQSGDREAEDSGQHYPDTGHSLQCEVQG